MAQGRILFGSLQCFLIKETVLYTIKDLSLKRRNQNHEIISSGEENTSCMYTFLEWRRLWMARAQVYRWQQPRASRKNNNDKNLEPRGIINEDNLRTKARFSPIDRYNQ